MLLMTRRYLTGSVGTRIRPSIVHLEHLYAHNEQKVVLYDLSLQVRDGQAVAILGQPGTGKTALLASIAGQVQPLRGHITVLGTSIPPLVAELERHIGMMPALLTNKQTTYIPAMMKVRTEQTEQTEQTVQDVIQAHAHVHHLLLNAVQISAYAQHYQLVPTMPLTRLSAVQRRFLALATTCIHDPQLVLLDEPLTGLTREERDSVNEYIRQLQREGRTLLVTFTPPVADTYISGYDVIVHMVHGQLVPYLSGKR